MHNSKALNSLLHDGRFTKLHTCRTSTCSGQWLSQQEVMPKSYINFLNISLWPINVSVAPTYVPRLKNVFHKFL